MKCRLACPKDAFVLSIGVLVYVQQALAAPHDDRVWESWKITHKIAPRGI